MAVNKVQAKIVRLGDYITQRREKNDNLNVPIRGVTSSGFIPPKQEGADTSLYNVFYKYDFVFNPARMELNSISLNLEFDKAICSSLYEIFYVNNTEELLPEYLNLFIKRDEFARFCWYDAIGSARNYFRVSNLQDIRFPLPDIKVQQELVDTYNGLKALAEQNEALIEPLTEACQAYIVDCKKKYPEVELGEYIEEVNERNINNEISLTQGIDVNMQFIPAKREAADKEGTKIVRTGQFAFNKVVKAHGTKLPFAYRNGQDCIISSSYAVFQIINSKLINEFLMLWFSRPEVHRYCGYISQGTTRDVFSYEDLCNIKIPLPPLEVQQAIVNLYNCAEEAKNIANAAREKIKTLCPALVQKAIHG